MSVTDALPDWMVVMPNDPDPIAEPAVFAQMEEDEQAPA